MSEMRENRVRRICGLFESYRDADVAYQEEVRLFGCTRLDWGFGRWLWLPVVDGEDRLAHWQRLRDAGILTNAGCNALKRADRMAAHFPDRAAEFGKGVGWMVGETAGTGGAEA